MKALFLLPILALVSCVGIHTSATSTTVVATGGKGSVTRPDGTVVTWDNEKSFADGTKGVQGALNSEAVRSGAVSLAERFAKK